MTGSGYISSQCCSSTEIELGTVYSAEMGITLLTDIDRYTLEDALAERATVSHLKGTSSVAISENRRIWRFLIFMWMTDGPVPILTDLPLRG